MDFVAIDFETANQYPDSACAIGLAIAKDGQITEVFASLIRPEDSEFSPRNMAVHGISPEDVADKPTFKELWPKLSELIGAGPLVAHNAAFDMRVLATSLWGRGLEIPRIQCACTLEMSRGLLPGLPNHRLGTLAKVFGIGFNHHQASDDAAVCARVAMMLGRLAPGGLAAYLGDLCPDTSVTEEYEGAAEDYLNELDVVRDDEKGTGRAGAGRIGRIGVAAPDGRFEGMRFVFTGDMVSVSREDAKAIVEEQGGKAPSSVSGKTDFVVVGEAVLQSYQKSGRTTGKLAKALVFLASGG